MAQPDEKVERLEELVRHLTDDRQQLKRTVAEQQAIIDRQAEELRRRAA